MKLVTFAKGNSTAVGAINGNEIVDLTAAGLGATLQQFIEGGSETLDKARSIVAKGGEGLAASSVKLLAPIPEPRRNIFCIGKNYRAHAVEFGQSGFDSAPVGGDEIPEHPIIFSKATTSVSANGDPILSELDLDASLDYEGELAVIIGKGGRGIKQANAFDHIYGYTVLNDVTAREAQKRHKQWLIGKGPDSFCPMGPVLVTADEIEDVTQLRVQTWVNDELRQDAPVSDLIFDIPTIIESLSRAISLVPGDIIATGTPAGVAIAFNPPRYMVPGDVVRVTIEGIGTITNPVI